MSFGIHGGLGTSFLRILMTACIRHWRNISIQEHPLSHKVSILKLLLMKGLEKRFEWEEEKGKMCPECHPAWMFPVGPHMTLSPNSFHIVYIFYNAPNTHTYTHTHHIIHCHPLRFTVTEEWTEAHRAWVRVTVPQSYTPPTESEFCSKQPSLTIQVSQGYSQSQGHVFYQTMFYIIRKANLWHRAITITTINTNWSFSVLGGCHQHSPLVLQDMMQILLPVLLYWSMALIGLCPVLTSWSRVESSCGWYGVNKWDH